MTRFVVTKSVDAYLNYVAIVDAPDATEARHLAETASLEWKEDGVTAFDETDFDNVKPEPVADDFAFGEVENPLLDAARQAEFWLAQDADSSGPGATRPDEILRVLRAAIAAAERTATT